MRSFQIRQPSPAISRPLGREGRVERLGRLHHLDDQTGGAEAIQGLEVEAGHVEIDLAQALQGDRREASAADVGGQGML